MPPVRSLCKTETTCTPTPYLTGRTVEAVGEGWLKSVTGVARACKLKQKEYSVRVKEEWSTITGRPKIA